MQNISKLVLVCLCVFLTSCGGVEGEAYDPASEDVSSGSISSGATVYATNCLACHGATGVGDSTYPDITETATTAIQTAVRNGKGTMPKFSKTVITTTQLADLIAFINSL